MEFGEVLSVLHGWLETEIEVSTHGAAGAHPIAALEARGTLRSGDCLGAESALPGSFIFVLTDANESQVAAIYLSPDSYADGGWDRDAADVLKVRCGVIQMLIAPVGD
jgi:hypothetical protein